MKNIEKKNLLTLKQASEILGCHTNTLRNWDREGKLKAVRFGERKDRRYKKEDVIKLLNELGSENEKVELDGFVSLPVFGLASCGNPRFFAEEVVQDRITVDTKFVKGNITNYFLVRSDGTSMDRAGIPDGSLVLMEKKDYYENGEDVLAVIDDMASIKRVYGGKNAMLFMPVSSDKKHETIVAKDNYHIAGKVVDTIPDPVANEELKYEEVKEDIDYNKLFSSLF